ncbi:MAG TPA: hypothetical protein VMX16_02975 [Terriglobia bacterium]|nr:hypothetical protein [Terriglobia bacterium]
MKFKLLIISSAVSILLGLGALAAGWQGTAGISLALPLAGSSFRFCGKAAGGWAVAGTSGLVLGIVLFAVALISLIARVAAHRRA